MRRIDGVWHVNDVMKTGVCGVNGTIDDALNVCADEEMIDEVWLIALREISLRQGMLVV